MKNEIKTLVVCSKEEVTKLKELISKITSEVQIKYETNDYKGALDIINNKNNEIDAIIIDSSIEGSVLELLKNYKEEHMLSKTIILDNIRLDCYNMINSNYQIFNILPKNYKIEELITSLQFKIVL